MRDRIRKRVKELGTSQAAISEAIGRDRDYIKGYLAGKSDGMNTENLLKLAAALKTTPEWLLEGRGAKNGDGAPLGQLEKEINEDVPEEDREETVQDIIDFGRYLVQKTRKRRAAEKKGPTFEGEKK